jgi:hypothetical protein
MWKSLSVVRSNGESFERLPSPGFGELREAGQVHGRVARPLHSEHRLKNTQQVSQRSLRQTPQSLDETFPIYGPQLVRHKMTIFVIKPATYTKWVWMAASGERGNNEGAKVSIQLVRRHDDTRPGLPDFRPSSGIQRDKEDVTS